LAKSEPSPKQHYAKNVVNISTETIKMLNWVIKSDKYQNWRD